MKHLYLLLLTTLILTGAAAQQTSLPAAEVSFSFTRQSGSATNQFAVWIEDSGGRHIKTLYATRWTANGGYNRRPTSIPLWVKQSNLSQMSRNQIDAISAATPRTGNLTYTWDGTDSRGTAVPAGNYTLIIEGTLRWENQVYYRTPIRLGQGAAAPQASVEYTGDSAAAERTMIENVRVRVLR
ncbi:MAG: DUF2271 domain-containing protein [Treponema sp.]|nr:DUF2271 domain-containing protein [Treponema sp.]